MSTSTDIPTLPPRPHPDTNEATRGHWDGAQQRRLMIQQCTECQSFIHYPMALCPTCQSASLTYTEVSGRGTVYSFAIIHQNFHPAFQTPYVIALTDLDDAPGVRLYTNILECDPDELQIGMPVVATFEDIGDGTLIPQFKPA